RNSHTVAECESRHERASQMIIYVFDARWPGPGPGRHWLTKVGRIYVSETTTIPSVVGGILKMANDIGELIELLRLCGHGNAGVQEMGQFPPGLNQTSASHFRALAGKFDSSGKGIEIHGCGVASGTDVFKGFDKKNREVCKPGTDQK